MTFPEKTVNADAFNQLNCMANDQKSSSSFENGEAYLIGHFMQEFDPSVVYVQPEDSKTDDLTLAIDKSYFMRVIFKVNGEEYSKDYKVDMSMTDFKAEETTEVPSTFEAEGASVTIAETEEPADVGPTAEAAGFLRVSYGAAVSSLLMAFAAYN